MTKPDYDLLSDIFSVPVDPRKKRVPRVVREMKSVGWCVEKDGKVWRVWHPELPDFGEAICRNLREVEAYKYEIGQ